MATGAVLRRDWFVALVFALLFIVASINGVDFLQRLEYRAYDAGLRAARPNLGAVERIALVTIDDESIRRIGPWPWPRNILGEVIVRLAAARPAAIALQLPLSDPQTDAGLDYIRRLGTLLDRRTLRGPAGALIRQAEGELDTDRRLGEVIASTRRVWLPMDFVLGPPDTGARTPLPDYVQRNELSRVFTRARTGHDRIPTARTATVPRPEFGEPSIGIGHASTIPDSDGAIRRAPLVVNHYGDYYPSLALLLAARGLNLRPGDITVNLGESLRLGERSIATDRAMQIYPSFYRRADGSSPFASYSFSAVRDGQVPRARFENRIVLIGASADRVAARSATPVVAAMSGPELTANMVASLLNQDFYSRPRWALATEGLIYLAILGYLMFLLPPLPTGTATVLSLVLAVLLLASGHYLLLREQVWLKTASPAAMLVLGHLVLAAKGMIFGGRSMRWGRSDSAQTNRLLGLAFQNQGQLDMALDKFRALPIDNSVLDLIYNLALDFERKRQFSKAAAAYDYILDHNAQYRDAAERRSRARQVDSTMVLGGGRAGPGGTLVLEGIDQKPTLGRYQIERELGKGAMGAVYLGRDPRINRVVAIKTLALSTEFEGTDLAEARERFFREAETAGRLKHPNIVTIYDAGEEHDLAYIAMEFLEGRDLTAHTRPEKLLPVEEVLEIVAQVAEALAYAHAQGVVHRDIKPANIMYDPASHSIKVTDFGIARVADTRQTRTGVVMGSPSYMSPEHLAGQRVDGRSDLFALGVTAFELLTGRQPFDGETLAALTYQIANAPHPDPVKLRRELPGCLRAVFDKALAKDPEQRYQTGTEFSEGLRDCLTTRTNKKRRSSGVA